MGGESLEREGEREERERVGRKGGRGKEGGEKEEWERRYKVLVQYYACI